MGKSEISFTYLSNYELDNRYLDMYALILNFINLFLSFVIFTSY